MKRRNARRYHISIKELRYLASTASLGAIPINALFDYKASSDKSEYDIHWLSGHFHSADPCGAGAFQVNFIFRFPYGRTNDGVMTEMLTRAGTVRSRRWYLHHADNTARAAQATNH